MPHGGKGLAILISEKKKPKGDDEGDMPYGNPDDTEALGTELLDAIEAKDATAIIDIIRSIVG